jgi:hypothetical protein
MSRQMRRNVMTETATQAKSSTSPIDVARSFFAAYAHDVERMVAACGEDAELRYVPMGSQGRGNARELGKSIWSGLIDAFPDLAVTIESIFGDKRNVAAEVVIGGTQQKDFLQIRSQGRHYDLPHAFLLQTNERSLITHHLLLGQCELLSPARQDNAPLSAARRSARASHVQGTIADLQTG